MRYIVLFVPFLWDYLLVFKILTYEKRNKEILGRIPVARWAEPSDLMGSIVFLASKASDYLNGHILAVDGGWLVR